jgi:hypothetical protein
MCNSFTVFILISFAKVLVFLYINNEVKRLIMGTRINNTCLYYFVHLDADENPIPGTMYGKNNNKIDTGYKCRQARLTGEVMTVPEGSVQCIGPLRYWYQLDQQGDIRPNSMIAVQGVPKGQAGRSCQYVEYKVIKPA